MKSFITRANEAVQAQRVPYTDVPHAQRRVYAELVKEVVEEVLADCVKTHSIQTTWSFPTEYEYIDMMPHVQLKVSVDALDSVERALHECRKTLHTRGVHMRLDRSNDNKAIMVRLVDMFAVVDRTVIHGKCFNGPGGVRDNLTEAGWIDKTFPYWVVKLDGMYREIQRSEDGPRGLIAVSAWKFMIDYAASRYKIKFLTHWNDHKRKETIAAYVPSYMKDDTAVFDDDIRYLLACNRRDFTYLDTSAPETIRDQTRPVIQGLRFARTIGDFIQHCQCSGIGTDFIPGQMLLDSAKGQNITKDLEASILWSAMTLPVVETLDQRLAEMHNLSIDLDTGNWSDSKFSPMLQSLVEPLASLIRNYERITKRKFFKE